MGLISQKSFSQGSVSVTTDDSMRFRVKIEKYWHKENDKVIYAYNDKFITVDLGSVSNEDVHKVNFYFTNLSDTDLVFSWVGWGEPNFEPESSPKVPISKGQKTQITYKRRDHKYPGIFNKTARITTNLGQFFISFNGYTLPENIYLDHNEVHKTIYFGDTIFSEFKIYNKSDTVLKIESIKNDWKNFVSCEKDELVKYDNVISPKSYRTFKVKTIPLKVGDNKSKVTITINDTPVEFDIFATVKAPEEK